VLSFDGVPHPIIPVSRSALVDTRRSLTPRLKS
jgi:hypothetical protein